LELHFGWHGLPEQIQISGRGRQTGGIEIDQSLKPQAGRRDAPEHGAVVAAEMTDSSVERIEQPLVGRSQDYNATAGLKVGRRNIQLFPVVFDVFKNINVDDCVEPLASIEGL
jgi:hypothetical protein